ncbi:benzoylformate decarboxylase [Fusarium bulbicola]|nr:benzoylformate decarboxylase [Fusarium bulbicola]
MEALAIARELDDVKFPTVITCPHEFVAMSMADGFARVTGTPQCVLVHVYVGTQMLGYAMHNASCSRTPVFAFVGLSPFTIEGEMRGFRTEHIHWLQDAHDQRAIVAQYCPYAGEFKTGKNINQLTSRALQFATSDVPGPVYMVGAREVMEEDIPAYSLKQEEWKPVVPAALPQPELEIIIRTLAEAESPLILVGILGVRVLDAMGSSLSFPFGHRASVGVRIGGHPAIEKADVILILDCDVTWIPTKCKPRKDANILHIDMDPLKSNMPLYYIPATRRYRADVGVALKQLNKYVRMTDKYSRLTSHEPYISRWNKLGEEHKELLDQAAQAAARPEDTTSSPSTSYLSAQLRRNCPKDTIWCHQTITNAPFIHEQLQVDEPGHILGNGGGGLDWSGGASLGVKLASDYLAGGEGKGNFVTQIVGDGKYLFGVPGTVYWVASRYRIATLTIVLSNKGWNAPRVSMELVHPTGYGSRINNKDLNISFDPTPDFSGIAKAASGNKAWAAVIDSVDDLDRLLPEAVQQVKNGVSAILEEGISHRLDSEVCAALEMSGVAHAAFPAWSKTKPSHRRDIFLSAANIMEKRREELLHYLHQEMGAGVDFQNFILGLAIEGLKDTAGRIAGAVTGSLPESIHEGMRAMILKRPYGVNLGIAPWNAPFHLGLRSITFPLATGNTAILKGAELTPVCYWAITDVLREAGLPDGCLNLVFHRAHSGVGAIISSIAGKHLKPVVMELGGKASSIVLKDADLSKAAENCARGAFFNAGQVCMTTERILVHSSIATEFQDVLAKTVDAMFGSQEDIPVLITSAAAKKNRALV